MSMIPGMGDQMPSFQFNIKKPTIEQFFGGNGIHRDKLSGLSKGARLGLYKDAINRWTAEKEAFFKRSHKATFGNYNKRR